MKKRHTPLVIGNWKMNPDTLGDARQLFIKVRKAIIRKKLNVTVGIAAPYVYQSVLEELSPSRRIQLIAQDVSAEKNGAHTGEVSASMLKSVGVDAAIIGHSERRAMGEDDKAVVAKLITILASGFTAIVCVGEQKRDSHGNYFSFVEKQLRAVLQATKKTQLSRLVIAYEPIWAIGTGKTATAEDAEEMKLFIQKIIADVCGRSAINKVRIIYGGSVKADNCEDLLVNGEVDGFLVGGASLKAEEFTKIILTTNEYGKN